MEKLVISDVKADSNIAQIVVSGVKDEPGCTLNVVRQLSDEGIIVDMILQSSGQDGPVNLIFTIDREYVDEAVNTLESYKKKLDFDSVSYNKNISKITLSGTGLMSHSDIVPRVLSCFHACNAPTDLISTSEIAIKVFTDEKRAKRVIDNLRDEFEDYGL